MSSILSFYLKKKEIKPNENATIFVFTKSNIIYNIRNFCSVHCISVQSFWSLMGGVNAKRKVNTLLITILSLYFAAKILEAFQVATFVFFLIIYILHCYSNSRMVPCYLCDNLNLFSCTSKNVLIPSLAFCPAGAMADPS